MLFFDSIIARNKKQSTLYQWPRKKLCLHKSAFPSGSMTMKTKKVNSCLNGSDEVLSALHT